MWRRRQHVNHVLYRAKIKIMSPRAQPRDLLFRGESPSPIHRAEIKIMSSRAQPRDLLFVAWRECLQTADPSAALGMTSGSGCCEWAPSCARLTTLGSRLRGNDAWRRLRQKCGAQFYRAHLVLSLRRRPQSSGVRGASTTYFSAQKLKLCHPERSRGICFSWHGAIARKQQTPRLHSG